MNTEIEELNREIERLKNEIGMLNLKLSALAKDRMDLIKTLQEIERSAKIALF